MSDTFDADGQALPPPPPGVPSYPAPSTRADADGQPQVTYPLAGFGSRAGGFLLDLLIVWAGIIALSLIAVAVHARGLLLILYVAPILYTWLMIGMGGGQTLGMRAAGVRCIDAITGDQISIGKALGRSLAFALFFILPIVGPLVDLLWPAWDKKVQTLHDKMAGTLVISTKTRASEVSF